MTNAMTDPATLDLDKLEAFAQRALASVGQDYEEQYSAVFDLEDALEPSIVLALIAAARERDALRSALDAMTKERDEWKRQAEICRDRLQETEEALGGYSFKMEAQLDTANRRLGYSERTLIGLVETAREALEPFAEWAAVGVPDEMEGTWFETFVGGIRRSVTSNNFRRAREALIKLNEATK